MAEGTSAKPDDVVCRYYFASSCRDGDRCLFSHDSTRRTPDTVCRYYLEGKCVFGQNCRYDHVRVNQEASSNNLTRSDRQSAGPSGYRDAASSDSDRVDANKRNSYKPRLTSLNRSAGKRDASSVIGPSAAPADWINAPAFDPRSYADIVKANTVVKSVPEKLRFAALCAHHVIGACPFGDRCPYVHGIMCELCRKACLHPYNEDQRKAHVQLCEKELEEDMELSFAVQRSEGKTCGICMDVVVEKEPASERRFGIHEKCNHVFCLTCIRKWRQRGSGQDSDMALDPVVTRACPECRVASNFVVPSAYYVDEEEDKKKLIAEYKKALSKKPCKYFKQGQGSCPFGGECFYLHAEPDGTRVYLPLPTRRRGQNLDDESNSLRRLFLWTFLEHREENASINGDLSDPTLSSDSDDDIYIVSDYKAL